MCVACAYGVFDWCTGIGYGSIPTNSGGIAKSLAIEYDYFSDPVSVLVWRSCGVLFGLLCGVTHTQPLSVQGVDDTLADCSPPHIR